MRLKNFGFYKRNLRKVLNNQPNEQISESVDTNNIRYDNFNCSGVSG